MELTYIKLKTKTFSINNGTYGGDGIQLQFSDEIVDQDFTLVMVVVTF